MSKDINVDKLLEQMVIKRIKGKYLNQLLRLIENSFEKENELTGFDKRRLTRMARLYRLFEFAFPILDAVHINYPTILAATSNDVLIGEIHAAPHGKRIWSLDSAAVNPMFRGRGVFGQLMKEAIEHITRKHGQKIFTSFLTSNVASVKITAQYGFTIYEEDTILFLKADEMPSGKEDLNVSIREARQSDKKQVFEICKLMPKKKIGAVEIAQSDFFASFASRFLNRVLGVHSRRWVVEAGGEIIGCARVVFSNPREAGNIPDFFVVPSANSKKFEESLLNHVLVFLSDKNAHGVLIRLDTERKQTLETLQRVGFRPIARLYKMVRETPSQLPPE